jgi:bifunctional UDP-N-acetylglucosamine pyrophosphorylase/glucosamine-1-phosphate N-acetyltransferase
MSNNSLLIIVLAAGKGVRMCSSKPKVLLPFLGRPMIVRTLDAVKALSPKHVRVVVGNGRELVEAAVTGWSGANGFTAVSCAVQESQLGTGDAVKAGLSGINIAQFRDVLIIPGDTPLLSGGVLTSFISDRSLGASTPLRVLTLETGNSTGFGRIIRSGGGDILRIVEEKDCTDAERTIREVNSSIYFAEAGFISSALKLLKNDNAQKEYYLTDVVGIAVEQEGKVEAFKIEDEMSVMGVNSRVELAALEAKARAKINEGHLLNGVAIEDPANTYISEETEIGQDSFVGAGTKILGRTTIGKNVVIEGSCYIKDSNIADGVQIRFGCYLTEATVGTAASVGPFAQLRPGAELGSAVYIGNFVEVKNSKLSKGAKANHLAYIGDADIGEGSNIGAGTIFCNYDGKKKHRSTIGKQSFVGSNSTLVAPVKIGDESYVGAGSVITEDVPDKALALGRARQVIKDGWERK